MKILSSVELKRRYSEQCFNCFYTYIKSQWDPKQHQTPMIYFVNKEKRRQRKLKKKNVCELKHLGGNYPFMDHQKDFVSFRKFHQNDIALANMVQDFIT